MTTVTSPLAGRAIGLAAVPDAVFSAALAGPGTALDPVRAPAAAVAPVDGVVVSLLPHAFVVVDARGRGVLTHLGIDTVRLPGGGFEPLVAPGGTVRRGDAVVRWDPRAVVAAGRSPVCPVVALEAAAGSLTELVEDGDARPGDALFVWT
ncbi:PTS glucose transporter subunit IIA [Streptomyces sp. B1866]|uniref:PTS sugar transporter subunit IIA n=1 Tax=Streptomyces sp. B1866 TaxID=3075431 RepID=UPI00288D923F|nr:PTS glucose transporter subunit IIA [Streptomyces sp. B1866]MDT3396737.1 PTS glucose transporter subunit IIA [Streptomyces sp. B1866]